MYGGVEYAGGPYAGTRGNLSPATTTDTQTALAVEVAFTTDPLAEPAWVDITPDVRSWSTSRGRRRELERHQPGRATIVLANRERQYDSVYTAGPWYGNLKPMKRVRIRETYNGVTYPVFDGFVDKWQLDYPNVGRDATATLTATDAFKIFARNEPGLSVYDRTVLDDAPDIYWRLDEKRASGAIVNLTALNHGTLGSAADGTVIGPPLRFGDEPLVVNDPGTSIATNQDTLGESVFLQMGLSVDNTAFDLFSEAPFTLEAWTLPIEDPPGTVLDDYALWQSGSSTVKMQLIYRISDSKFVFAVQNDASSTFTATSAVAERNKRHHVVATFTAGQDLQLYVDGVFVAGGTATGAYTAGIGQDLFFGNAGVSPGNNNWVGKISHAAVYTGANVLTSTQVSEHYATGSTPWAGDLPSGRIRRMLELSDWPGGPLYLPDDWTQLDDGETSFQSATIKGQTALEHAQKCSESEYASLLFIDRAGRVRFKDRAHVILREPYPVAFGDTAGEIGYRQIVPDDGDDVIRNRATISRLDGVVKTVDDAASIADFGIFQYSLDSLLMNSDTASETYAQFIVDEYGTQRRRITSLSVGPPVTGEEATVYPAMLGLELGDSLQVRHTPLAVGDRFSQVCVIEGIEHEGRPGGDRTVRFALSPELSINTATDLLLTESEDTILAEDGLELEVD